jgi:hypothetical protein
MDLEEEDIAYQLRNQSIPSSSTYAKRSKGLGYNPIHFSGVRVREEIILLQSPEMGSCKSSSM